MTYRKSCSNVAMETYQIHRHMACLGYNHSEPSLRKLIVRSHVSYCSLVRQVPSLRSRAAYHPPIQVLPPSSNSKTNNRNTTVERGETSDREGSTVHQTNDHSVGSHLPSTGEV